MCTRKGKKIWLFVFILGVLIIILYQLGQDQSTLCKIVTPNHIGINNFSEGLALIKNEEQHNSYGYIDRSGRIVFQDVFDYVDSFSEGLAVAQRFDKKLKDYRFGYVDRGGKVAIKFQFNDAKPFSEDLAAVKVQGQYGYINKSGDMVIQPRFDDAYSFSEGRAKIVLKGKCGFIDQSGKMIIEPHYYKAGPFSAGLAFVGHQTKCGYIDRSGQIVIDFMFDDAKSFRKGLAPVRIDKKWKYITSNGSFLSNREFDEARPFSEGLAVVGVIRTDFYDRRFGGYSGTRMAYGFIDETGEFVIQPKFLSAESFSDGLSRVSIPEGDWFGECEDYIFIDKIERKISKRLEFAQSFKDGLALVLSKNRNLGFINTAGRFVIKFNVKKTWFPTEISPRRRKRYGFIDAGGKFIVKPRYHSARSFSEGLAYVDQGKRGFIDKQGNQMSSLDGTMIPHDFSQGLAAVSVYD
jgi:hypothetical protein